MDKQEINEHIARFCGWERIKDCWYGANDAHPSPPPNYARDLNAVHEAEKKLSPEQWAHYCTELYFTGQSKPLTSEQDMIHAPAWRRAEAFYLATSD